jgi:hypothetical protein
MQGWTGPVEILTEGGTYLDDARAQLHVRPCPEGGVEWHGILRAGIGPKTLPWPSKEPVLLRGIGEQDLRVRLTPTVVERGPVLFQVASVNRCQPAATG